MLLQLVYGCLLRDVVIHIRHFLGISLCHKKMYTAKNRLILEEWVKLIVHSELGLIPSCACVGHVFIAVWRVLLLGGDTSTGSGA